MGFWLALAALSALALSVQSLRRGLKQETMMMKLNCKPNDVAMVVRAYNGSRCARARLGMVVQVRSCVVGWVNGDADGEMTAEPAWLYDRIDRCKVCGGAIFALADSTLKPLPPEDSVWKHDYEQEERAKKPTVLDALLDPYRV